MPQTLYILTGPKGSGKTTIGSLVDRATDIRFIRVEPIWLGLAPGEDGWETVERAIGEAFRSADGIMIESLGAGEGFERFHRSLARKYRVRMIRVVADLDRCLERVRTRRAADHIAVSDDKVEEYNRIAAAVVHDWVVEIDNNGPASDDEILAAIERAR